MWLIGGQTGIGQFSNEILVSDDDGATWASVVEDAMLPESFNARGGHATYLDDDGQVWIIGGQTKAADSEDIETLFDAWKGKLNKL